MITELKWWLKCVSIWFYFWSFETDQNKMMIENCPSPGQEGARVSGRNLNKMMIVASPSISTLPHNTHWAWWSITVGWWQVFDEGLKCSGGTSSRTLWGWARAPAPTPSPPCPWRWTPPGCARSGCRGCWSPRSWAAASASCRPPATRHVSDVDNVKNEEWNTHRRPLLRHFLCVKPLLQL